MAITLPIGTDTLDSPSHSKLHRVIASDASAPDSSLIIGADGLPIIDAHTASELVATDADKKLSSLPVATYPSLAELAYVKGVTSTIQDQIDGKQDTLVNTTNIKSVNGTTLLGSGNLEVGGGGGAVDWIAKTTTYTAENGDGILADTSSSAWTLTLPATPSVGDVIGISDSNSTFDTNNLTVANNSSKIHGVAESLVVDLKDASFLLVYTGSTTGWKLDTYLQAGGNITLKLTDDLDADNHGIIKAKTIGFNSEYDNGSKTASTTISFSAAQKQKITLTENTLTLTLSTTDLKVGNYLLKIVNGGLATLTWASSSGSIYWSGGEPTLTSSGTDLVAVYFDGTNFYCQASLNFE